MANWCSFKISLKSNKKENITGFLKHIQLDGKNYNNYEYLVIPRAVYDSVSEIYEIDNNYYLSLSGSCAWSCAACMLSSSEINYNKLMKNLPNLYAEGSGDHIISIEELCAIYNTEAEIIGDECDIGFTEHYYIDNKGKVVVSETKDFDVEELWSNESFDVPDDYDLVIKLDEELKRNDVSHEVADENLKEYTVVFDIDEDDLPF